MVTLAKAAWMLPAFENWSYSKALLGHQLLSVQSSSGPMGTIPSGFRLILVDQ
jgi:hypothetical protein